MKVFVAGGSGAIGMRLVPKLLAGGHEVVAMTRSEQRAGALRALGAEAAVADALDRQAVEAAVRRAEPEAVINQLTALEDLKGFKEFDREFALTNRLRTEGNDNLLAAAGAAGARRFVAQSYAGWTYEPSGSGLKAEEDRFDPNPPKKQRQSMAAIQHLERVVAGAEGIEGVVLRYGNFYGPGTGLEHGGTFVELIEKRRFPVVGDGAGVWSFVQIEDAATAAVAALDRGAPGAYNVADDRPAPVSEWLPALAAAVGAKPPRRVPVWLGRLAAGEVGVAMMTRIRGISNAKARRELGWQPSYPTYVEGFRDGLGPRSAS